MASEVPYGPSMSNIGNWIQDRNGRAFEVIDETPDGRHVIIQTGYGDTTIDLELDGVRLSRH